MQNYYYNNWQQQQYAYVQNLNNSLLEDQKKKRFRKDCSKVGFNIVIALIVANIFSIPFILFLLISKENVIDSTSLCLFNAFVTFLAFFAFEVIYMKVNVISFNEIFPFKKTPAKKLIPLLVIGYSVCTIANFAAQLINDNFALFGIEYNYASESFNSTPFGITVFFITTALAPAICEEFAFRGVILGSLKKYGDSFAIFTSAVLFGLVHGNLVQIPFAFIVGLILGYLRVYTDSMLPSIILHFINNGIAVIFEVLPGFCGDKIINIFHYAFLIVSIIAAFISIIYLSSNDKKLFTLGTDKISGLSFSEKIRLFVFNPGIINAFAVILIIILLPYFFY